MVQVFANSLAAAGAYAIVAIGFGLIYSATRFFHFAHGAVYIIAAYGAYTMAISLKLGWWAGLICGILIAGALGGLIEVTVYRQMRRAKASSTVLFLASLGILVSLQNLISLAYGDGTLVLRRESANKVYEFLGAIITKSQIELVVVAIIICAATWVFLHHTIWGRQIRATANDPVLAKAMGVDIDRVLLIVFILGSALAGLAAIMFAQETDLRPSLGVHVLLFAVVAMVIGGVGSVPGSVLGALLVALLRNFAIWLLPAQWGDTVAFGLLILFLLCRPYGILGKPIQKATV